ncbi:ROK family protein [Pseudokineococcus marinus]|uniref:ROK family protein n=1 Tax=Pseudokineococcus marinus TaxID=351215 RepID=A0A849BL21_9ACTN|nr:ROK family protein [Pseudokineococcus marinus]NNH22013.1 ROK family protein [Pseudokineococcus marinus]
MTALDAEGLPRGVPAGGGAGEPGGRGAPGPAAPLPDDQVDGLVAVLDLVRSGVARTRPELARQSGLGRSAVAGRVARLLELGLLDERGTAPSSGGRAPRELALRADAGLVLVAPLGASHLTAGVTDLEGRVLAVVEEPGDVSDGPDVVLGRVDEMLTGLLEGLGAEGELPPVRGVGVGLPGPVEFASGRPNRPPIMPGWHDVDVRARTSQRWGAPTWVDNDVNLMALGELVRRRDHAPGAVEDMLFVKVGTGIGAGLVGRGRLLRGSHGCAGDIGHVLAPGGGDVVCRCGNTGCLEAVAGGAAMVRRARELAEGGASPPLARALARTGELGVEDLVRAAQEGDRASVEVVQAAGRLVGQVLATLVNFFDPGLLVLGGRLGSTSDLLLASVRQGVYERSLPLATRDLRVEASLAGGDPGVAGAAAMVLDELFGREHLRRWLSRDASPGRRSAAA